MCTKNVKSHNFTKSILKSFLNSYLSEAGSYQINKFNEFGDDILYNITNEKDINYFLENDNNFYLNVKGLFGKGIEMPFNRTLIRREPFLPNNESIKKIKKIEEYWNNKFENAYYQLMGKIHNKILLNNQKLDEKLSNQISKNLLQEKHKKIILNFIGLNLFRSQFIKEKQLAQKITISNLKKSEPFWLPNSSEEIYDYYDYLNKNVTLSNTESFIESFIKLFENHDIKFVQNIFGTTFTNPPFIHLFGDNVLILPIAFKDISIILIKKNHLIEFKKNKSFSLFKLTKNTSLFCLFCSKTTDKLSPKEFNQNLRTLFCNELINAWISYFGSRLGDFYVIKENLYKTFKDEFKTTKELLTQSRKQYYEEKQKNATVKDATLLLELEEKEKN